MQLLGRRSVYRPKCTLLSLDSFRSLHSACLHKTHFLIAGQSHPHNTQYWHCRALQAYNRAKCHCFVFPFWDTILSARGGDHGHFVHFPVSNKRPKRSYTVSLPPRALRRNTSAQGQAPGEKSSGHAILSLPPFSVFASWGTGRSHNHLSGRPFISYKCSFPEPQLRKASLYKKILRAHTSVLSWTWIDISSCLMISWIEA